MQSLTIPRGQVGAGGRRGQSDGSGLLVAAGAATPEYGIVSTAFLEYAFRTDSYALDVTFNADGSWSYISDTMLTVRGQAEPFQHRDRNTLFKVGEPAPNPLAMAG